jgi:hypothetical protein
MGSLNECWVLDCSSWKLREGLAEGIDALSLHFESTLLWHRSVKSVIKHVGYHVDKRMARVELTYSMRWGELWTSLHTSRSKIGISTDRGKPCKRRSIHRTSSRVVNRCVTSERNFTHKRDTSQIPKDDKETPSNNRLACDGIYEREDLLLMVHIPCLWYAFFTFTTNTTIGINVWTGGKLLTRHSHRAMWQGSWTPCSTAVWAKTYVREGCK